MEVAIAMIFFVKITPCKKTIGQWVVFHNMGLTYILVQNKHIVTANLPVEQGVGVGVGGGLAFGARHSLPAAFRWSLLTTHIRTE